MPRVIAIQMPQSRGSDGIERPAFDFSPAAEYGEVEVLAPNGKHILTPDLLRKMLEEKLRERFNPDEDYIIPVGDYSVIFLVGMLLGRHFTSVRILRWVPSMRAYQPVILNLGE